MMKCPKCGFDQPVQNTECLKCGIVFEKCRKLQALESNSPDVYPVTDKEDAADRGSILQILFYVFFTDFQNIVILDSKKNCKHF